MGLSQGEPLPKGPEGRNSLEKHVSHRSKHASTQRKARKGKLGLEVHGHFDQNMSQGKGIFTLVFDLEGTRAQRKRLGEVWCGYVSE